MKIIEIAFCIFIGVICYYILWRVFLSDHNDNDDDDDDDDFGHHY